MVNKKRNVLNDMLLRVTGVCGFHIDPYCWYKCITY